MAAIRSSTEDPLGGSDPPESPINHDSLPHLPSTPGNQSNIDSEMDDIDTPRAITIARGSPFDFSSDPLNSTDFQPQQGSQNRKRGPSSLIDNRIDKNPRIDFEFTSNQPTTDPGLQLILEARDLLVRAYTLTSNRGKQARLLDLLEVFREYTEHGRIRNTTTILASQVANLEQATRKIEKQASNTSNTGNTSNNSNTWSKVAKSGIPTSNSAKPQTWQISSSNRNRTKASKVTSTSSKETINIGINSGKGKLALTRRGTLLQARNVQATLFSSIATRNLLNTAFKESGIQELVVSMVSLSIRGNLVVTTTPSFDIDFLIKNEGIVRKALPLLTLIKKGEPWYKVAIHGIPIREFTTTEGKLDSELVAEEIRTFNKGLTPIGQSYWATPSSKRESGLVATGTIIVAFPTEKQAKEAISNRLYIAGISAKVAKHLATPPTFQCTKCSGFGHAESLCKRKLNCLYCASNHSSKNHVCNTCNKSGIKCKHTTIKCVNCNSTTHSADSKLCEVYLAIKNKANSVNTTINSNSTEIIIDE